MPFLLYSHLSDRYLHQPITPPSLWYTDVSHAHIPPNTSTFNQGQYILITKYFFKLSTSLQIHCHNLDSSHWYCLPRLLQKSLNSILISLKAILHRVTRVIIYKHDKSYITPPLKTINGPNCLQDKILISWNLADKAQNDPDLACLSNLISHYSFPPTTIIPISHAPSSCSPYILFPKVWVRRMSSPVYLHPPYPSTHPDLLRLGYVIFPDTH